ncbi:hypothetical protein GCM10027430_26170 [Lysobacter tyrosinilyticus]
MGVADREEGIGIGACPDMGHSLCIAPDGCRRRHTIVVQGNGAFWRKAGSKNAVQPDRKRDYRNQDDYHQALR